MKIAIPVTKYYGLENSVYGHFGSAPAFALVDAATMAVALLANRDQGHIHGACSPIKALAGAKPDAVVVNSIGAGALLGLRSAGIKVYRFAGGTVAEAVRQFQAGALHEMDENAVCAGHADGHTCH